MGVRGVELHPAEEEGEGHRMMPRGLKILLWFMAYAAVAILCLVIGSYFWMKHSVR